MEYIDEEQLLAMAITQKFINNNIVDNIALNEVIMNKEYVNFITINDVQNLAMGLSCKLYEKGVADYIFLNDGFKIVCTAKELGLRTFPNSHMGYLFAPRPEFELEFQNRLKELTQKGISPLVINQPSVYLSIVSEMLGIKNLAEYQEGKEGFNAADRNFTTWDRVDEFRKSFDAQVAEFVENGMDKSSFRENHEE